MTEGDLVGKGRPAAGYDEAVNPPALRRMTGIAWLTAVSLSVPTVVAIVDGLTTGHARHAMLPDFLATLATVGLPIWVLSVFGGAIALRRTEPRLAPADARYPNSRRLGVLIMGIGVLISVVEVACFEFWPGKQNPRWFGSAAGICAAFVGLAIVWAVFVRIKERRMALGLWTDPRAIWDRLRDVGGSPDPAVAVYYGRGPEASAQA